MFNPFPSKPKEDVPVAPKPQRVPAPIYYHERRKCFWCGGTAFFCSTSAEKAKAFKQLLYKDVECDSCIAKQTRAEELVKRWVREVLAENKV